MIVRRNAFNFLLLHCLTILVFIRATNMGFGYPSSENLLATITYIPQKFMQIFILMGLVVFVSLNLNKTLSILKPNLVYLSLLIIVLCSILFSPDFSSTLRYFIAVTVVTLPIYLHFKYLGSESLLILLQRLIITIVFINFIYIIIFPQFGVMSGIHSGAWRGMFVHKNELGGVMALLAVVQYATLPNFDKKYSSLLKLSIILNVVLVVMSKSATAYVTLAVCFTTYFFIKYLLALRDKQKRLLLLVVYVLLMPIAYVIVSSNLDAILLFLGKDPTLTGRTELWEILLEVSAQHPLIGMGIGYFSRAEVMAEYAIDFGWEAKSTHSSYIDLILGIGYSGLYLVLFIIIKAFFSAILTGKDYNSAERASFLSVIFGCLVVSVGTSGVLLGTTVSWFLLVCALCVISTMANPKNLD